MRINDYTIEKVAMSQKKRPGVPRAFNVNGKDLVGKKSFRVYYIHFISHRNC